MKDLVNVAWIAKSATQTSSFSSFVPSGQCEKAQSLA